MHLDKLAPRERELADGFHRGDTRSVICKSMGITANTLQNYLTKIYLKLGIDSVAQLVLIVERDKAAAK